MKRPKPVMRMGKVVYPQAERYAKKQLQKKIDEELERTKYLSEHGPSPLPPELLKEQRSRLKKRREQKLRGPQQRESTKHKTYSDCHPHFREHGEYLLYFDGTIRNRKTQKIINSPTLNEGGYATLGAKSVHRMMAESWLINPNPDEFTEVNHIDKNRSNNNIENLEWVDRKNNILHRDGKPYYAAPRYYTECKFT